jgi:large subunit ribosomal protein L23
MITVIKKPLITEKTTMLAEKFKTYAFEVDTESNKTQIKHAVESGFSVKVVAVRTMIVRGRWLKVQSKYGPPKLSKKALVTLAEGQTIALFEGA